MLHYIIRGVSRKPAMRDVCVWRGQAWHLLAHVTTVPHLKCSSVCVLQPEQVVP